MSPQWWIIQIFILHKFYTASDGLLWKLFTVLRLMMHKTRLYEVFMIMGKNNLNEYSALYWKAIYICVKCWSCIDWQTSRNKYIETRKVEIKVTYILIYRPDKNKYTLKEIHLFFFSFLQHLTMKISIIIHQPSIVSSFIFSKIAAVILITPRNSC